MEKDTVLIEFIKKTKNGEYASINKEDLKYVRLEAVSEEDYSENDYYYYNIR